MAGDGRKKIAVLVRDRQSEALRMSVGLIAGDDEIDVYILNRDLEDSEDIMMYLETLRDMGLKVYSNIEGGHHGEFIPTDRIAQALIMYDHVVAY
jgi:hypothetical protein